MRIVLGLSIAAASLVPLVTMIAAQANPAEIPFESIGSYLRTPATVSLGEAAGVAVDAGRRRLYVFSRGNVSGPAYGAAAAQLLEFDLATGRFTREIGRNLYAWSFAHAVRVDAEGNIWAVDSGSDMVVKFDVNGQVQMVLGRKKPSSREALPWESPLSDPPVEGAFRQPTDVTWDSQGNIYVSDGHINSRITKFDKDGNWLKSWGTAGADPGEFDVPHSLAIDAQGHVYVGDAGNRRIQVFDGNGTFQREFTIDVPVPAGVIPWMGKRPTATEATRLSGTPWTLCMTPGANQVLYAADAYPGRVYKLSPHDGKVLGVFGESGRKLKQFGWIHGMACPTENDLYVAELLNWRVQKLILKPAAPHPPDQ